MNLADIMLLAAMLLLVGLALWFAFRRKKRGGGCSGGCSGCRYSGGCPSARMDEEDTERKE